MERRHAFPARPSTAASLFHAHCLVLFHLTRKHATKHLSRYAARARATPRLFAFFHIYQSPRRGGVATEARRARIRFAAAQTSLLFFLGPNDI